MNDKVVRGVELKQRPTSHYPCLSSRDTSNCAQAPNYKKIKETRINLQTNRKGDETYGSGFGPKIIVCVGVCEHHEEWTDLVLDVVPGNQFLFQ